MRAVALGLGAAAGGAVAAVGTAAFEVSRQTEQASRNIEATLNVSRQRAEELGEVAKRVFGNNFAGSVQEAGRGGGLAQPAGRGRGRAGAGAGRESVRDLRRVRRTGGQDIISAVATLSSEFDNLDPTEAFDLVAAGFQRGLDQSQATFLDSIGEYSNQFLGCRLFGGRVLFDDGERAIGRHAGDGQNRRRHQGISG